MPAASQARRQVDFYFSDSNFPRDKHLQTKALEDPEGYVPLEHINTFERMKRLNMTVPEIAAALEGSEVVMLSPDKLKVKRRNPLPEVDTSELRTVYVKGLPKTSTLDSIQEYIEKASIHKRQYHCDRVTMRKVLGKSEDAGKFKGSALITLSSIEEAEAIWEEYGKTEGFVEPKPLPENPTDEEISKAIVVRKASEWKKEKRAAACKAPPAKKAPVETTPRTVVAVALKIPEGTEFTREMLKEAFLPLGAVAFVSYQKGETKGHVRFATEEGATAAAKTTITHEGVEITPTLLSEDETKAYLKTVRRRR